MFVGSIVWFHCHSNEAVTGRIEAPAVEVLFYLNLAQLLCIFRYHIIIVCHLVPVWNEPEKAQ